MSPLSIYSQYSISGELVRQQHSAVANIQYWQIFHGRGRKLQILPNIWIRQSARFRARAQVLCRRGGISNSSQFDQMAFDQKRLHSPPPLGKVEEKLFSSSTFSTKESLSFFFLFFICFQNLNGKKQFFWNPILMDYDYWKGTSIITCRYT